jgi:hypothetical protein
MSIFGYYFVVSLLDEMGWPRKQGLLKREVYDTTLLDAVIDQMIDWAASLGAGRPFVALQIIAEMFRDRNWDGGDAPQIEKFINSARPLWDSKPKAAPREIVNKPKQFKTYGAKMSKKNFQDPRLRVILEHYFLDALLWGLANPDRFKLWYTDYAQHHESSLNFMQRSGLNVDKLPVLGEFFTLSEEIVRDYERDIVSLPSIPDKLLSDARRVGIKTKD